MRKIKVNRACTVNGSQWRFKKGQVLDESETGPWIIDHLLALGYADVHRPKKNKHEE